MHLLLSEVYADERESRPRNITQGFELVRITARAEKKRREGRSTGVNSYEGKSKAKGTVSEQAVNAQGHWLI